MIVTRIFLYKMILVLVTIFLFFVDYNNCSYQLICIFTLTDLFCAGFILWKQGCVTLDNPIFLVLVYYSIVFTWTKYSIFIYYRYFISKFNTISWI